MKVYRVSMAYSLYRGFWVQARTLDEAMEWAEENLTDLDNFSNQEPFVGVDNIYESSFDEARMSFQTVFDARVDPYQDDDEYDDEYEDEDEW